MRVPATDSGTNSLHTGYLPPAVGTGPGWHP